MKTIKTIGIVGAGTMGAALAQKFAQENFSVVLADREDKFVHRGIENIIKMLQEGVEKRVFTPEKVQKILSNIKGTANLSDLKECDLVIEAIFENFEAKKELFNSLSNIVPSDTIIATNTSSYSVTELAYNIVNPERFIGLHFFFHAAKNRLVEIIRGSKTSDDTFNATYRCMVKSGKDPIMCEDAYGFVVNRFFVPWLNEAVRLLEEKVASPEVIDYVCMQTFGIGMGPFALMNATGVPVAYHAEKTLEIFGNLYKVADMLKAQAEKNEQWELKEANADDITPSIAAIINERMLGIVFFVCAQLIEENVCTTTDLNKGARIGLQWKKGPVDLIQQYGNDEVKLFIANIAGRYSEKLPGNIEKLFFPLEYISLKKTGDTAIIRFNRPEDLNALNEETVKQLDQQFKLAEEDSKIKNIVITGSGKAFVAGADIKFFVKNIRNKKLENIVAFTKYGQEVFEKIDKSNKKVIVVLNGMAFGGGLELALCADTILSVSNAVMAFPETGIGIYPGLGGTFRAKKKLGKGLAKYLILTGKLLTAKDALNAGLVDNIISVDEMLDITEEGKNIPEAAPRTTENNWAAIAGIFEANTYENLLQGINLDGQMDKEEYEKLSKTIRFKAPVAMKIAEELINNGTGPDSELQQLTTIFSTEDALLGLSSVGKKVEFKGK
jgi:enoyl-CoA hydratase / 3-hydroxyacyl-CoA dehydrogenase